MVSWSIKEIERFWSRIDKLGPLMPGMTTRCHLWTGAKNKRRGGYGVVSMGGKILWCHRVAFELTYGPPCSVVRHRCDNPPCSNPEHLLDGSHADNTQDKINRDRAPIDTWHHATKVTFSQVLTMRADRAAGAKLKELVLKYGISIGNVSDICSGKRRLRGSPGKVRK